MARTGVGAHVLPGEADRAQSDGAIDPDRSGVDDRGPADPAPIAAYLNIFAAALTPCALFAIGLGLSVEGIRSNLMASIVLAAVKLVIMPLIVYGLCVAMGLNPLYTIAAVICAAVPTAKTVYILAGEYKVEEPLVAATVSITTLVSVATLMGWLYALSGLGARAAGARRNAHVRFGVKRT